MPGPSRETRINPRLKRKPPSPMARYYEPKLHPLAHPAVKRLHREMVQAKMSMKELSALSGVGFEMIRSWLAEGVDPRVMQLEFCLQVFSAHLNVTWAREPKSKRRSATTRRTLQSPADCATLS